MLSMMGWPGTLAERNTDCLGLVLYERELTLYLSEPLPIHAKSACILSSDTLLQVPRKHVTMTGKTMEEEKHT